MLGEGVRGALAIKPAMSVGRSDEFELSHVILGGWGSQRVTVYGCTTPTDRASVCRPLVQAGEAAYRE